MLHVEQQERLIADAGLSGQIEPDEYYTPEYLDVVVETKREENWRKSVAEKASAFQKVANFGSGMVGGMLDPVTIASCFIPVIPAAVEARLVASAGSALGRAGVRAGIGAAQGLAGSVVTEPLVYAGQKAVQADYDLYDSLVNVASGLVLGGAMSAAGGWFKDRGLRRKGLNLAEDMAPESEESWALMESHRQKIEESLKVSRPDMDAGELAESARRSAALYDNYARGRAKEKGISIEDAYKEFELDYSSGEVKDKAQWGDEGETYYSNNTELRGYGIGEEARKKLMSDNEKWNNAIDEIARTGKAPLNPTQVLSQTPLVLQLLGKETALNKAIAEGGVWAAPHVFHNPKHPNMTPNMWRQIPEALADPIAIFKSDSPRSKNAGDIVVMVGIKDANGATTVLPIAINANRFNRGEVHILKSAYTKEVKGKPKDAWFLKQLKENGLYVNQVKMERWRGESGSRLSPDWLSVANAHGHPLHTEADLVKLREANPTYYHGSPFDPSGSVTFYGEQRSLVRFFDGANGSTPIHEMSHIVLERYRAAAMEATASMKDRKRWDDLCRWLGIDPAAPLTREAHEKYAQAMEKYIVDGKLPIAGLTDSFEEAAIKMRDLNNRAALLGLDMPPGEKAKFDRMNTISVEEAQSRFEKAISDVYTDDLTKHLIDEEGLAEAGRKAEQGELSLEDMSALADAEVARAGELLASLEGERPEFVAQAREELRQARADLERELAEIGERGKLMEQFVSCQLGI